MSEIILKSLHIINFKGIANMEIAFESRVQNIWGANGTGKTSIADAFHWLLFGKNSMGEADFGIKPVDSDNNKKDHTDVEVSGVIDFSGRKIHLKHRFIEKWSKIKGSEKATFTGNTHEYFVDNAPYTIAEYKEFIGNLVKEDVFPLITNPLHFPRMQWQKQRTTLLEVAGDVSNEVLVEQHPELKTLVDRLLNKTLSKFKQEVVANKNNCKAEMEGIPTRIDETRRNKPQEQDFDTIQLQIEEKEKDMARVEEEITNASKASQKVTDAIRAHESTMRGYKLERDRIADAIRANRRIEDAEEKREITQKNASLKQLEADLASINNAIDRYIVRQEGIQKRMEESREEWKKINAEEFKLKDGDLNCPTCQQPLPEDEREVVQTKLRTSFNNRKAESLASNKDRGVLLKTELTEVEAFITARQKEIIEKKLTYDLVVEDIRNLEARPPAEKVDIEKVILDDIEYRAMTTKIQQHEAQAPKETPPDLTEQRQRQQSVRVEISTLTRQLADRDTREKADNRIEELKKQEKDLAATLQEWEHLEFLIEKFTKVKIDTLTDRINERFAMVKFKMFNYLQNGGVEETCEMMVNGVPYSDLNTAGRINAGLDLINVLSAHHGVVAPIVIDNRESIVDIIQTSSQVINLIVKEGVSPLHVGKNPPAVKAKQEALAL